MLTLIGFGPSLFTVSKDTTFRYWRRCRANPDNFLCRSFPPYLLNPLKFPNTEHIINKKKDFLCYSADNVVYYCMTHRIHTYRPVEIYCSMMWMSCKSTKTSIKGIFLRFDALMHLCSCISCTYVLPMFGLRVYFICIRNYCTCKFHCGLIKIRRMIHLKY